jgi:rhamnopyranosyl-N-acetylglucosaminyl-diphospho-decaprenol beta-1,3/1,4-galactofuranosyltransferase
MGERVRVLVQIHTWNNADIIESLVGAISRQTFRIEEVLIVDNASTDGTAEQTYPALVTLVRHERNLGTSGSVKTGLAYGLSKGYDWLWVLDADSRPRPDALELLVGFVEDGHVAHSAEIGVVCSAHNLVRLGQMLHGRVLTPGGPRLPKVREDQHFVECDSVIWSGALINLAVVEQIGWPRVGVNGCWEDLSLDYGDIEYSYRIHRAGFAVFVHRHSLIDHPIGKGLNRRVAGREIYSSNHPPFRRYLYFRNLVFFWLSIYHRRNWPMLLVWFGYRLCAILIGIVLVENHRGPKLAACFAGILDGIRGRLNHRRFI